MEEKLKKYIIIFKEEEKIVKEIEEIKTYLKEEEKLEPYKIIPAAKAILYESTKEILEKNFPIKIEEDTKVHIC